MREDLHHVLPGLELDGIEYLVIQFIGESMIYVALSMLLALALVEVLMPRFNAFLGRTILFDYWRSPDLAAGIAGAVLLVGALAGAYPALVLSAFPPAWTLRSRSGGSSGSQWLREALVILQFAILIGLTVSTGILYRQSNFATRDSLRLDKDQVLLIRGACAKALKDEVRALSGVRAAACSFVAPFWIHPRPDRAHGVLRRTEIVSTAKREAERA